MQAIILAGGKGVRLRPLTNTVPKPMVPIAGKPFLEYQIKLLRDYGIKDIVLSIGYLGQQIIDYFGDGSKLGVNISYSVEKESLGTGGAIKLAGPLLENKFIVVYGDSYLDIDYVGLWDFFEKEDKVGLAVIYDNKEDTTVKKNIALDEESSLVLEYNKQEESERFQYIEAGVLAFRKDVLNLIQENQEVSLEKEIFPELIAKGQMLGYKTGVRFYDIGNEERIRVFEGYVKSRFPSGNKRLVVFIDRDGVINEKAPEHQYITSWDKFVFLTRAIEAIKKVNDAGLLAVVITNQRGIARGLFTEEDIGEIHEKMKEELAKIGAHVDAIYYCPHNYGECDCRKPKIGMVKRAVEDLDIDLSRSFYIGDSIQELETAKNAGIPFVGVMTGNGSRDFKDRKDLNLASDLYEAVDIILKKARENDNMQNSG